MNFCYCKSPCKGCNDRTTGEDRVDCHATCEKYKEFREKLDKANKESNKYKMIDNLEREKIVRLSKLKGNASEK